MNDSLLTISQFFTWNFKRNVVPVHGNESRGAKKQLLNEKWRSMTYLYRSDLWTLDEAWSLFVAGSKGSWGVMLKTASGKKKSQTSDPGCSIWKTGLRHLLMMTVKGSRNTCSNIFPRSFTVPTAQGAAKVSCQIIHNLQNLQTHSPQVAHCTVA